MGRECSRIFNLHTVIINGYTHRTSGSTELPMTKRIDNPFSNSFIRNSQMLFALQTSSGYSRKRKMLEYESHCRIKQLEQISLYTLIIHKDHFVYSFETCQP